MNVHKLMIAVIYVTIQLVLTIVHVKLDIDSTQLIRDHATVYYNIYTIMYCVLLIRYQ